LEGNENKNRYIVATQSAELREALRKVPGVPLIYLNASSVVILEQPSQATLDNKKQLEASKQAIPAEELASLQSQFGDNVILPEASTSTAGHGHSQVTKAIPSAESVLGKRSAGKRRAKAPNPLANKKRKHKQERPIAKRKQAAAAGAGAGKPAGKAAGKRKTALP
jgi:U3 small nucleolar RNA-associated protein 23